MVQRLWRAQGSPRELVTGGFQTPDSDVLTQKVRGRLGLSLLTDISGDSDACVL